MRILFLLRAVYSVTSTGHFRPQFQLNFLKNAAKRLETSPAKLWDSTPSWESVGLWKMKFGGTYMFFLYAFNTKLFTLTYRLINAQEPWHMLRFPILVSI